MAVQEPRILRRLFALGAVVAVMVAAAFYLRGVWKGWQRSAPLPKKIAENLSQSASGFTYAKSDGPKMLFTIQASSFQQYKDGQRYELHGVSITLYGKQGDRADHIYGSDFEYNKNTGEVMAKGPVEMDLNANPATELPGGKPAPLGPNVVHLKTSGLIFNDNTGVAQTPERIEFQVPLAEGSAVGAVYNSRDNVLTLKSAVKVVTTGQQKSTITGERALVLKNPQRVILEAARIEQPPRVVTTDKLTVFFRENSTVQRIEGAGKVHALAEGPKGFDLTAPEGLLEMDRVSKVRSGTLSGGVNFSSRDPQRPAQGRAGKVLLSFGGKGTLEKVSALDSIDFTQGPAGKSENVQAAAADFYFRVGKVLERAVTSSGPAQIALTQGNTKSTISAAQFEAKFTPENRLRSLVGSPDTKIVSSTPGQPDRVSTSREVEAVFSGKGEIASAEQRGNFHFIEGQREAWAENARYNPADETYKLTGSPRVVEADRSLSADSIQLSRKNSTAVAQGNVKTTYNQKAQPAGAMLASADPVHVTGSTMAASRVTGVARYTAARLWRGPDIVQAPTILFDQAHRRIEAQSDPSARVSSVFVQMEKSGKATPVNISSDKLTYVDADRKAVFSGNVVMKIEGSTVMADTVQALLQPRGNQPAAQGASQLDRIVAEGDIEIQQPERKATGTRLVYTANDEKFVLTGSAANPPSIFDAERGQIRGDSLTFFTHDGRVLVGSESQPLAETKVQDASKK